MDAAANLGTHPIASFANNDRHMTVVVPLFITFRPRTHDNRPRTRYINHTRHIEACTMRER